MSWSSSDSDSDGEYHDPRERSVPIRKRIVSWRRRHVQRRFLDRSVSALRIFAVERTENIDRPFRIKRCTAAGTDRAYLVPRMEVALKNKVPGTLDYLFHTTVSKNLEELHLEGLASWRRQLSTGRGRLYLPRLRVLTMNALHPNFETDLQLDAPNLRVMKIFSPILSHGGHTAEEITNRIEELHLSFGEFHNTVLADESVPFGSLRRLTLEGDDGFIFEEHFTRFAEQLVHCQINTENPDLVHCVARQAVNLQTFLVNAEAFVDLDQMRKLLSLRDLVFTGYYSARLLANVFVVLPNLTSLSAEIDMAPHIITPKLRELEVVIREDSFDTDKVADHFMRINHHVQHAVFRVQPPNVYPVPINVICMLNDLWSLTLIRVKLVHEDIRNLLENITIFLQRIRFSRCNIVSSGENTNDVFFANLRLDYRHLEIIVD